MQRPAVKTFQTCPHKRKVWHEMKQLNITIAKENWLEDFKEYVFGISYQTLKM